MHVQPGYSSVTPCQTDQRRITAFPTRHIVRKEVTPHNGLATVCQHFARIILLEVRFHACEPHSLDSLDALLFTSPSLIP
jgi:hypothetical protein